MIRFSTDAASNDVASPPILWVEGQPAGTVNNSAREMMAALAKWRDDNAGGLGATRGAGDVYSVATSQVFDAATIDKAHTLAFTVNAQNQGPTFLSVDGLPAAQLLQPGFTEIGPGDLRPGIVYRAVRTGGAYVITAPTFIECGTIQAFASPNIPAGWLPCDGRAPSRTAYARLFIRIGTFYGAGDGSTTFNVPDLRGRTMFGVDALGGRLTGAGGLAGLLGSAGGYEMVALSEAQLAAHSHGGSAAPAGGHNHLGSTGAGGGHDHGGSTGAGGGHAHTGTTNAGGGHSHSGATDAAGQHAHGISYLRQTNYRTDGASGGTNALNAGDGGTNTTGITDGNGAHAHGLAINAAPDHQHGFTTAQAGDHAHIIPAAGNHTHEIGFVNDHTHALAIASAGLGQGHSNVPPGLVVTFAIKV